jgi:hypothetical protein
MGFVKLMKIMVMGSVLISPSLLWADPIPIDSIDEVKEKVSALLKANVDPQHIGVVLDFHGVITKKATHTPNPKLKGNIKEVLEYFRNEKILCVIATAWPQLNDVVQKEIIPLGIAEFFDINESSVIPTDPTDFHLGKDNLRFSGYKNGRATALKYSHIPKQHFAQKAFALECVYPKNAFEYIIFVDDNKHNLETFQNDFEKTIHKGDENFKELILFHLESTAL